LQAQQALNIYTATLGESGAKTGEISTEEMRRILAEKSATVFDVRPAMEFATSHIPGAVNVAQKPGTSKALYVSDVAEISGIECVGEVVEDTTGQLPEGARVAAMMGGLGRTRNGSYAEFTCAPATNAEIENAIIPPLMESSRFPKK